MKKLFKFELNVLQTNFYLYAIIFCITSSIQIPFTEIPESVAHQNLKCPAERAEWPWTDCLGGKYEEYQHKHNLYAHEQTCTTNISVSFYRSV